MIAKSLRIGKISDWIPCIPMLTVGVRLVVSFGGRAIVALAVVFGLAMLDWGPRASAAFLPIATSSLQNDMIAVGGMGSSGSPETGHEQQAWPPRTDEVQAVQLAHTNPEGSSSGGSGSSPSSSSGSSSTSTLPTGNLEVPSPSLVARFRAAAHTLPTQLFISAIFEPPRVGI